MAIIWDLAVVYRMQEDIGSYGHLVHVFDVPGGKATQEAMLVASLEEGAAYLMQKGYEPFGASRTLQPLRDNIWFRREVKTTQIRFKPGILRKLRRR